MIKYLRIGDITIKLSYQYTDYFSDKINAYEIDNCQEYREMIIEVKDHIQLPNKPITFTYKNRLKMASSKDTTIVTMTNKKIKHMIYYTHDYQKIVITLNENIGDKLAELEYVLSGMMFFEMAMDEGYLPIHASCINVDDHTFLLSGPSKSGKSTQTNYFRSVYPQSTIINEDKPLVYLKESDIYVIGSPWSGKHVINENKAMLLTDIFFINQASNLSIKAMDKPSKLKHLFRNIHRPSEESLVDQMLDIVSTLIDQVQMYQFNCVNDIESSKYLMKFMEDNNEN